MGELIKIKDQQSNDGLAKAEASVSNMNPSVRRILDGAIVAVSQRGATLLSMTDIAAAAKVSRATLYRYFPHKEQLLAELADYIVNKFNVGVKQAVEKQESPIEKFRAVLSFVRDFSVNLKSDRIMEVEPNWILESRRLNFPKQLVAVNEALSEVYDDIEKRLNLKLDRAVISETIFRFQESTTLIPINELMSTAPDFFPEMLESMIKRMESKTK